MPRFAPIPTNPTTVADVNDYVQHFLSLRSTITNDLILSSWMGIANLYHRVDADTRAEKFLLELLGITPRDEEANALLGRIYRKQGRYTLAVKYYERFLQQNAMNKTPILEASELCLKCAQQSDTEREVKDYATRAIYWAKRSRRWTKSRYSPETLLLLKNLYELLLNRATTTEWVNQNVTDILRTEESFTNVHLHIVLIKALIKKEDFTTAWDHVSGHRDTFADNMDWNLFVKEEFETLRRGVPSDLGADDEPSEMYLGACDNVLRIAVDTGPLSECDRLMREFRIIVDTHDLPASRRTKAAIRRWSRIRQEYQSRACRHQATISLRRGPQRFPPPNPQNPRHLSEPLEPSHHEAIRSACLSLRMCLSYHNLLDSSNDSQQFSYLVPRDVTDSLGLDRRLHILMCQRLAESSHRLLSLLRCFQFSYMRSKNDRLRFDQQYNIVGRRKYDSPTLVLRGESEESEDGPLDVKKWFYLPTVWGVEPSGGVEVSARREAGEDEAGAKMLEVAQAWPDSLLDLVAWIAENKETVDEVAVMTKMYDLTFVLEVVGWNVENDALRRWLRGLFPRIVDYPKLEELESSHQCTPTPTLMDLETFIMILLLQRHAVCVVRGGAHTMGQILFMAGQNNSVHSPSEGQVRFWRTCLCLFGRPTAQRKHYMGDVMTGKEIKQCLREIRGEFVYEEYKYEAETVERQNYLYLALGIIYQNLIELHNMDCSIEAIHYLGVYEAWKARGGGTSDVVRSSMKETVDHQLGFLVLDEKASDEEYKMLVRHNDGDQAISSLHISSPSPSPTTLAPSLPDDDDNPFKVKPPPPIVANDVIIDPTVLASYVLGVANTRHLFASSPKFDERGRVSECRLSKPKKGVATNTTPRKVVLHLKTKRGKKNKVITPARFGGWEEREGRDMVDLEEEDEDEDEEDDGAGGKGGRRRFELVVEDPDGARTDIPIGNVQRSFWAELSIRRTVETEDDRWLEEEVARGVLGREGEEEEIVPNEPLAVTMKRDVGYNDSGYVSMFGAWEERMEERERDEANKKKIREENLLVQAKKKEENPVRVAAYTRPVTPTRHGLVDVGPLRFASPPPMVSSPDSDDTQAVLRTWARPNVNTSPRRRATAELLKVQPPPLLAPAPRAALFTWPPQRSNLFTGFNPAMPPSPPSPRHGYGRDSPVSPYIDSEDVSSEENIEEDEGDEGDEGDEREDEGESEGDGVNERGSDWSLMSDSTNEGANSPDGKNSSRLTRQLRQLDMAKTLSPSSLAMSNRFDDENILNVREPI